MTSMRDGASWGSEVNDIIGQVIKQARNSGRCEGLQLACELLDKELTHDQKLRLLEKAAEELCKEVV